MGRCEPPEFFYVKKWNLMRSITIFFSVLVLFFFFIFVFSLHFVCVSSFLLSIKRHAQPLFEENVMKFLVSFLYFVSTSLFQTKNNQKKILPNILSFFRFSNFFDTSVVQSSTSLSINEKSLLRI